MHNGNHNGTKTWIIARVAGSLLAFTLTACGGMESDDSFDAVDAESEAESVDSLIGTRAERDACLRKKLGQGCSTRVTSGTCQYDEQGVLACFR